MTFYFGRNLKFEEKNKKTIRCEDCIYSSELKDKYIMDYNPGKYVCCNKYKTIATRDHSCKSCKGK